MSPTAASQTASSRPKPYCHVLASGQTARCCRPPAAPPCARISNVPAWCFLPAIPRSRVPELAAAHMQQEQGGQVRLNPIGKLFAARLLSCSAPVQLWSSLLAILPWQHRPGDDAATTAQQPACLPILYHYRFRCLQAASMLAWIINSHQFPFPAGRLHAAGRHSGLPPAHLVRATPARHPAAARYAPPSARPNPKGMAHCLPRSACMTSCVLQCMLPPAN